LPFLLCLCIASVQARKSPQEMAAEINAQLICDICSNVVGVIKQQPNAGPEDFKTLWKLFIQKCNERAKAPRMMPKHVNQICPILTKNVANKVIMESKDGVDISDYCVRNALCEIPYDQWRVKYEEKLEYERLWQEFVLLYPEVDEAYDRLELTDEEYHAKIREYYNEVKHIQTIPTSIPAEAKINDAAVIETRQSDEL